MPPFHSVVRRVRLSGLILLAVVVLVGALLPSAALAYSGDVPVERGMGPGRNYGYQSYRNYNPRTNYRYNQSRYGYGNRYDDYDYDRYYHKSYQKNYGYGYDKHGYSNRYDACAYGYRVHWGDNLSRIARRYGTSVYALSNANRIRNPNRIYAGEYLCIPHGYGYHR